MNTEKLEALLTDKEKEDKKKKEEEKLRKEQIIIDKEVITESGKILLKD